MICDAAASPPDSLRTTEELLPLLYEELRLLAMRQLAGENPSPSLHPTALVHEAYARLGGEQRWDHQGHFFAAASEAMRRVLIDRARHHARPKHGGHLTRVDMKMLDLAWETEPDELLAVDDALQALQASDPLAAKLVNLRFYAGVPNVEAARLLGISPSSAKRLWAYARAFLHRELSA